jgi:hypothetical protein
MGKVIKEGDRPGFFAEGGKGKMFDRGTSHNAISDVSGKDSNGGTEGSSPAERPFEAESYTKGVRYLEGGGSNRMFSKGHASKAVSGQSGKPSNG